MLFLRTIPTRTRSWISSIPSYVNIGQKLKGLNLNLLKHEILMMMMMMVMKVPPTPTPKAKKRLKQPNPRWMTRRNL